MFLEFLIVYNLNLYSDKLSVKSFFSEAIEIGRILDRNSLLSASLNEIMASKDQAHTIITISDGYQKRLSE